MTYTLIWIPEMGVFGLDLPGSAHRELLTEEELRQRLKGNEQLNAWADYAKANPGREVLYDMLPR